MASFGGAIGSASFQEPVSNDPTSAPAEQVPQGPGTVQTDVQQPLSARSALAATRKKKKLPGGPTVKQSSGVAAALARSKKARQGGSKFGG